MDVPTVVLRDLLQLTSSVSGDDHSLESPLVALVADLSAAISSYRGLHLTIVENGHHVNLTAFGDQRDAESITTSLRIPLPALGSGFDPQSRIVFYAATSGAFVDLAADLGYALRTPTIAATLSATIRQRPADSTDDGQEDGQRPILLDADLPPPTLTSGLTGLHELSTINQAVGTLIEQGHQPDQVHATLRRHAAAAGLEPHSYAARLLRR